MPLFRFVILFRCIHGYNGFSTVGGKRIWIKLWNWGTVYTDSDNITFRVCCNGMSLIETFVTSYRASEFKWVFRGFHLTLLEIFLKFKEGFCLVIGGNWREAIQQVSCPRITKDLGHGCHGNLSIVDKSYMIEQRAGCLAELYVIGSKVWFSFINKLLIIIWDFTMLILVWFSQSFYKWSMRYFVILFLMFTSLILDRSFFKVGYVDDFFYRLSGYLWWLEIGFRVSDNITFRHRFSEMIRRIIRFIIYMWCLNQYNDQFGSFNVLKGSSTICLDPQVIDICFHILGKAFSTDFRRKCPEFRLGIFVVRSLENSFGCLGLLSFQGSALTQMDMGDCEHGVRHRVNNLWQCQDESGVIISKFISTLQILQSDLISSRCISLLSAFLLWLILRILTKNLYHIFDVNEDYGAPFEVRANIVELSRQSRLGLAPKLPIFLECQENMIDEDADLQSEEILDELAIEAVMSNRLVLTDAEREDRNEKMVAKLQSYKEAKAAKVPAASIKNGSRMSTPLRGVSTRKMVLVGTMSPNPRRVIQKSKIKAP